MVNTLYMTLITFNVELLGVSSTADKNEIKKAYFQLAKKYHPDVNPSKEARDTFNKINEAYETLSDESKRQLYDQTGMSANE